MKTTKDSYNLDSRFECVLVTALCYMPKLFSRVGHELIPDLLNDAAAKLSMKAALAIDNDMGRGPDSLVLVTQRLRRWLDEGKVTQEEINGVMDFFDNAEEYGIPSDDSLVEEIAPILKHRARDAAVHVAIETLGKHSDMTNVTTMLNRAERIGLAESSTGVDIRDFVSEVSTLRNLVRLPTGIIELDHALLGGPERGSAYCFVGGPGDGKSMGLIQVAAHAWILGHNVVYATLELNKAWSLARFVANVTGIPINKLLNGSMSEAERRMKDFWENENPGLFHIEAFTPKVSTLDDVKELVNRVQDRKKAKVDVVVIDYCDKLGVGESDGKQANTEYVNMLNVYEPFRVWMDKDQIWGWTASQAKCKSKDKKKMDTNDMADSMNKPRVLDGVITLNKKEDQSILAFIAKCRNGISGVSIGPLPTDFAHGRIFYLNREVDMSAIDEQMEILLPSFAQLK